MEADRLERQTQRTTLVPDARRLLNYISYTCALKGFQKTGLWLNVNKIVMSLWVHSDLTTLSVITTHHLNECRNLDPQTPTGRTRSFSNVFHASSFKFFTRSSPKVFAYPKVIHVEVDAVYVD